MIGLFCSHEAALWRQRSVECAVEATIAGAEAFVAAQDKEPVRIIKACVSCVVLAGLSVASNAMVRVLDSIAAGQPEPTGKVVVVNVHRRRAEDVN